MDLGKINSVYFLGIGGIGMSALARFFLANGKKVGGYDKTSTALTLELEKQGMEIHFEDTIRLIPSGYMDSNSTLIVRTPAVPDDHTEYIYFLKNGFSIMKRAEVLGIIFNAKKGIAIAGTHGKTSVTTFTSYLLRECGIDCSAFLGGISKNFNTNLLLGNDEFVVAEADEFDRSFLHLHPYISLVTTVDADHLDIYSGFDAIEQAFAGFVANTKPGGIVILKEGVKLDIPNGCEKFTYSFNTTASDFYASDIKVENDSYSFTFNTPKGNFKNFRIEVPGKTNIENAIGAMSVAFLLGISGEKLCSVLPGLRGVVRRFDVQYKDSNVIYYDDYAHHPRELDAVIGSLRDLHKGRKITGIFQPHLYSRTRDFADDFAKSLSALDELILLDIYPAREKPIPGVTSDIIFDKVSLVKKHHCSKINLLDKLKELNIDILLTAGAGDIDQMIEPIKNWLNEREEN